MESDKAIESERGRASVEDYKKAKQRLIDTLGTAEADAASKEYMRMLNEDKQRAEAILDQSYQSHIAHRESLGLKPFSKDKWMDRVESGAYARKAREKRRKESAHV